MKTTHILTAALMAGGLVAFTGLPSNAQHSSGGTPPSVTEGKGGESGKSGSGSSSQGERHDSVNKKGQAESSGKMSPNERTMGGSSGSGAPGSSTGSGAGSSSGSGSGGK
jgi:hypothetical protein